MKENPIPSVCFPYKQFPHLFNLIGMKARIKYNKFNELNLKLSVKDASTRIKVKSLAFSPFKGSKQKTNSQSPKANKISIPKTSLIKEHKKLKCFYEKEKHLIPHIYEAEKSIINCYNKNCHYTPNKINNNQQIKLLNNNVQDKKLSSTSPSFYPKTKINLNESNSSINKNMNNNNNQHNKCFSKTTTNFLNRTQSLFSLHNNKNLKCQGNEYYNSIKKSHSVLLNGMKNYNDFIKPSFITTSHALINVNAFRSKQRLKDVYGIDKDIIKTFNKHYFGNSYIEGFDFNKLKMDGYEIIKKNELVI